MKSYTDIEQSKKLAEILPLESADMRFCFSHTLGGRITGHYPMIGREPSLGTIPCWSLAALLNLIPKHIKDYNVLRIDISENEFVIWYDELGYGVNMELPDIWMKEPVDACVKMIIKLHEQKLL